MTEVDYETLLTDVRQAWRIVVAYQKRVLFLLQEIEAGFPELAASSWEPGLYARPPRGQTQPWKKWAWDGLSYFATINWFTLPDTRKWDAFPPGNWFIVTRIIADDGYHAAYKNKAGSIYGPDPAQMPPADTSKSYLELMVYKAGKDVEQGLTPYKIWKSDPYDNDAETGVWVPLGNSATRRIWWDVSLADLFTETGTADFILKVREELKKEGVIKAAP
ncbi:MAG: hypothetical protein Q4G14_06005 [Paracoccus sp. (in: a-proteobacteria)]|uniref:hypothetical protein n=1 Tax=Paracoccus sp. TaxID=267 RepID=UPI0026E100A3|nr:hypothetical protein [Paracoccus sp. (in: a-proteobacteria)]MDO5612783.1 hypothetical protein [Paracoccus sp. (in: a-proteobacteria)]